MFIPAISHKKFYFALTPSFDTNKKRLKRMIKWLARTMGKKSNENPTGRNI